jgi:hypothetical protein
LSIQLFIAPLFQQAKDGFNYKNISLRKLSLKKTEVFYGPKSGLSQVPKGSRLKQKKKKKWDNFLGANLQVCHPKGPFLNLGRPCGSFPGP